jgi:hypothetical protein
MGKSVCAKRSGRRTIYLNTIDWTVCSHYKAKAGDVVRDWEGGGLRKKMSAEM